MKVVHLCLGCFFPDNYSYQENMLPKFHKQLGYEVEVIASLVTFDKDGKGTYYPEAKTYKNEYDIKVTRLNYKKPLLVYRKLKRYIGVYEALVQAAPGMLFIHGCQFRDMDVVVKYLKKHPGVKVYVDNHADFSNSGTNFLSKSILHKGFWKHSAKIINPYTTKFYGVLPARVDWLVNMYKLPKEKCELLVMGADDDKVREAVDNDWKEKIRKQYRIKDDDFLIMTGGKIDAWKTQTLLLMEAVKRIDNQRIRLIVFGSVTPELKEKVNNLADGYKVQYIGWIRADDSYHYWAACDLAVFPGRHSVFWEQVAGMGIPMICKYWEGTNHIDIGGNVVFLYDDSVEEIRNTIMGLISNPANYSKMVTKAQNEAVREFSYSEIAKKSIEVSKCTDLLI